MGKSRPKLVAAFEIGKVNDELVLFSKIKKPKYIQYELRAAYGGGGINIELWERKVDLTTKKPEEVQAAKRGRLVAGGS